MAKKTLILVRHGQYHKCTDDQPEQLTTLGKKQAQYVARRLSEYQIDRIIHSSMPRAAETAQIIKERLNHRKTFLSCDELRECVPGFPKNRRKKSGFTDLKKLKDHQAQAERAFKKHFKTPQKSSVEVLVCHGNIIRYLVSKTLGVDTLAWTKMDIHQCGITIIEIKSTGDNKRTLISHNDVGHIPLEQRTFL